MHKTIHRRSLLLGATASLALGVAGLARAAGGETEEGSAMAGLSGHRIGSAAALR